jgi:hypothetical protein
VHPAFCGPHLVLQSAEKHYRGCTYNGCTECCGVFLLPFLFSSLLISLSCHVSWRRVRICTAGSNSCSRLVLLLVCVVLLVATAAAAVPRLCLCFKAVTFPLSLSRSPSCSSLINYDASTPNPSNYAAE